MKIQTARSFVSLFLNPVCIVDAGPVVIGKSTPAKFKSNSESANCLTTKCQEHRISWKISNGKGHGLWMEEKQKSMLDAAVSMANLKHGYGTHWIKTREA